MNPGIMTIIGVVLQEALEHGKEVAEILTSPEDIQNTELYNRIPKTRRAVLARAQRKLRQVEKGLSPV